LQTLRARGILCNKQASDRAGLADRKGSILAQFIALHLFQMLQFLSSHRLAQVSCQLERIQSGHLCSSSLPRMFHGA